MEKLKAEMFIFVIEMAQSPLIFIARLTDIFVKIVVYDELSYAWTEIEVH